MIYKLLLLKNFHAPVPEEFITALHNANINEATLQTIHGTVDFNRWSLWCRFDAGVIEIAEAINKKYPVFEFLTLQCDPFRGYIECADNGKESWNAGPR